MKKLLFFIKLMLVGFVALSQSITLPPSGDNQKCSVTQWMGLASVTVTYNSPDLHDAEGKDRTDHIWGELVPYGFTDPGYGTSTSAPWRVGANENTTIQFSHSVVIDGKKVAAGTYGLFLVVEKDKPWTWILSADHDKWGHYHYNPANDVIRVEAASKEVPSTEYLTFAFDERLPASTVLYMQWEKKRVDLKIQVSDIDKLYVDKIRGELQGHTMGFSYQPWMDAARFCAEKKINLEEALTWADYAINGRWIGKEDFASLQTKAIVLEAMGKTAEAEGIMTKALSHPSATMQDLHSYGRSLLQTGKNEKALAVFKLNRERHPNDKFTTYVGLARAYTALGDKKNAIKNWETALKNLPADQSANRGFYEAELKKLKS